MIATSCIHWLLVGTLIGIYSGNTIMYVTTLEFVKTLSKMIYVLALIKYFKI